MSTVFPVNDDPRFRIITTTLGQTELTVPFPFQANADITVIKTSVAGVVTQLARPSQYTLTGAGASAGGTVTLVTAAKAGETYLLLGKAVPTRTGSVVQGGRFNSLATDADFDRLTILVLELLREDARSVVVPYGASAPELAIGAAGTIPVWDEDGNLAEGPSTDALEAIETALAVEAGRALVHGTGDDDPFAAGGRKISGLADATEADEAITKSQLDAFEAEVDPTGLTDRVTALELGWYTGDFKFRFASTAPAGWLVAWGGTIGSADSGGDVRANADTEDLFEHLWDEFDNTALPIFTSAGASTTRGASAAADFAANKRLTLPNLEDRFPRAASSTRDVGLTEEDQNKQHNHTASTGQSGTHSHNIKDASNTTADGYIDVGGGNAAGSFRGVTEAGGDHTHSVTVNNSGGDEARPKSFVLLPLIKL